MYFDPEAELIREVRRVRQYTKAHAREVRRLKRWARANDILARKQDRGGDAAQPR